LHADLAKRRNLRLSDVNNFDREMDDLVKERNNLLAYSNLVNSQVGPNGETAYDIFWAVEKNLSAIKTENVVRFSVSNAIKLSRQQINEREYALQDLAKLRNDLPLDIIIAWSGLKPKRLSPGDEDYISRQLINLLDKINSYIEFLKENKTYSALAVDLKMETVKRLNKVNKDLLLSKPETYFQDIAVKFSDKNNTDLLYALDEKIEKYRQLTDDSALVNHALADDLCIESVRSLFHSVDLLKSLGYSDKVSSDIVKIIAIYDQVISLLRELNNIAGEMNGFMPKETSSLADCYNVVAINKDFIESLPDIVLKELRPQYALASTKNFLDKAREECELLVKRMTAHSAFFNVRYVPAPARINELVRGLLKYRDSLFAFFQKNTEK